jgi:hypothetical protein
MPVTTVVPVVSPFGVQSVVGVAPAAAKIVAVVEVAVVVRMPVARICRPAPQYRYCVPMLKSFGPVVCGLIVAVVAVDSAVPALVCHGAPQFSH